MLSLIVYIIIYDFKIFKFCRYFKIIYQQNINGEVMRKYAAMISHLIFFSLNMK